MIVWSPEREPSENYPRVVPNDSKESSDVGSFSENVPKTLNFNGLRIYNCWARSWWWSSTFHTTIGAVSETRWLSSIHKVWIILTSWVLYWNVRNLWIYRNGVFIGWAAKPLVSYCNCVRWWRTLFINRNSYPVWPIIIIQSWIILAVVINI